MNNDDDDDDFSFLLDERTDLDQRIDLFDQKIGLIDLKVDEKFLSC